VLKHCDEIIVMKMPMENGFCKFYNEGSSHTLHACSILRGWDMRSVANACTDNFSIGFGLSLNECVS